jgi:pimeloyl-ACP methyl ester carboxylesterase
MKPQHLLKLIVCLAIFIGIPEIYAQNAETFSIKGCDTTLVAKDRKRYPSFEYTGYRPLADKPVRVFYYVPTTGDIKDLPVLFVLSGAQRVGNGELNPWYRLAEKYGFVVINPQFTKELYDSNAYQFGNVAVEKGSAKLNKKSKWTYNIVEDLFDYYLKVTDSNVKGYYLFGHSAGGQFVHRLVMMLPDARYIKAVAANPSAWTTPLADGLTDSEGNVYGWPYSVKDTPSAKKKVLKKVLSRRLYVQIGTKDIQTKSLDQSAGANAQGPRRYHRALKFYDICVETAKELGIECGFRLAVVEGTRHSTLQAVYGYSDPDATKINEEELGVNSAFNLLFRRD